MVYTRSFHPGILIHPGMSLKDILESENMTQKDLNLRTEISEKHISNIIKGKASITPETALKLEKVFGISSDYWNNLQKSYDEDLARIEEQRLLEEKAETEKEIIWEIEVYNDLAKLNFVESTKKVDKKLWNLYSFFWVSSLKNILNIFKIDELVFKKTDSLNLNRYNLACWLRAGELKIKDNIISDFSKKKVEEVAQELKSMTQQEEINTNKIKELLASAWIHFSYIHGFRNVPVFGITRKYKWAPFIQVSDRWKKTDMFWFALFHELAHVLLHLSKKDDIFINVDNREEDIEAEANTWAANTLISEENLHKINSGKGWVRLQDMQNLCKKEWIWMSILAWRLAHEYHQQWYKSAYIEVASLRSSLVIT